MKCANCDHLKSTHFDSTGSCSLIRCHCPGFVELRDEEKVWARILGDLVFENAALKVDVDELRAARLAVNESLASLSARISDLDADQRTADHGFAVLADTVKDEAVRRAYQTGELSKAIDLINQRAEQGRRDTACWQDEIYAELAYYKRRKKPKKRV